MFHCENKNVNCPKCNNIIERSELKNPNEEISKSINISILKDELFQTKDEIRKLLSELSLLKSLNKKNTIPKIIKPKEEKVEKEISKNIINLPPLKEKKEKPKQKIPIKNIIKVEPKFILLYEFKDKPKFELTLFPENIVFEYEGLFTSYLFPVFDIFGW